MSPKGPRIETKVRVINDNRILPRSLQIILFHIVRAALSNIKMHTNASNAAITLEAQDKQIKTVITDNGKGFQAPIELGTLVQSGKLGLFMAEELVLLAGGMLRTELAPGKGTKLTVELPLDAS
jgi:signal transduction histidine kinase